MHTQQRINAECVCMVTQLITLGSFMLFLGFLSFNGASISIRELGENWGQFYSRGAVNTILSSSSSAMCVVLFSRVRDGKWSLIKVINGSICGMVAVCAGCSHVEPWAGFLTGLIAGFVYLAWSDVVPRFGVDDPLDAVAVHAGGGTWGLFAVALLDADRGLLLHWDSASGKVLARFYFLLPYEKHENDVMLNKGVIKYTIFREIFNNRPKISFCSRLVTFFRDIYTVK